MLSLLLALLELLPVPAVACTGDFDGSGEVTVNELLVGMHIALGSAPISACPSFDRSGDGAITINELLDAVNAALTCCPPMATPTGRPPHTPTASCTPTATPTPTILVANEPPLLSRLPVYWTYPGFPIRLPIAASDPEGGPLHYRATALPDGAVLDEGSGVVRWLPRDDQLGPFYILFTVSDDGEPPKSTAGRLAVQVLPLDACIQPSCMPVDGCESALVPPATACCNGAPVPRLAEAQVDCPEGKGLLVGRNTEGFGKLQDCDRVQVVNFAQGGTAVRLNIAARCVDASAPVTVDVRLEMRDRLLIDRQQIVTLQARDNGYAEAALVPFAISGAVRFLDLEGQEANLDITITDDTAVVLRTRRRLILTAQELPDLPESDPVLAGG